MAQLFSSAFAATYEAVWLPHDAKHQTFVTKQSVIDRFMAHDLPARISPDPDAGRRIMHGKRYTIDHGAPVPKPITLVDCYFILLK
ncbi:hypothetical protein [Janthinobacterium sp. 64]|uniref:hypothetical protein n=1 Tax=Janthinobacterium sp. 64 TaxID=2035208 RepID=UPI0012FD6D52|nr:hypothetical protein [Janthinobacterium sp. 64]